MRRKDLLSYVFTEVVRKKLTSITKSTLLHYYGMQRLTQKTRNKVGDQWKIRTGGKHGRLLTIESGSQIFFVLDKQTKLL